MSKSQRIKDGRAVKGAIGPSGYGAFFRDDSGNLIYQFEFVGGEIIGTTCPKCKRAHLMSLEDFFWVASRNFDVRTTRICCPECSARHFAKSEAGT